MVVANSSLTALMGFRENWKAEYLTFSPTMVPAAWHGAKTGWPFTQDGVLLPGQTRLTTRADCL